MKIDQKKAISIMNRKKAKIFIVKYSYKHKVMTAKISKFSGYAKLMTLKVEKQQRLHIDYRVLNGSCILGYVQDKKFIQLADAKFNQEISLDNRKGFIRFKVIGEQADVHLEIKKIDG